MAKLSSHANKDKDFESYVDTAVTTHVEMVLTTANTNRSVPIPDTAAFIELYGDKDFRFSLSSSLEAKATVSDTDAVAGDVNEGVYTPAYVMTAAQLAPAATSRTLYLRSANASTTVQVNFRG